MTASPSLADVLARRSHETAYGGVVVTSTAGRRRTVVRVHGELDTAGTARLERVCAQAAPVAGSTLLLDLESVTFANSAAIAFLQRLQEDLGSARVRVILRPSELVRRLLDLAGPSTPHGLSPTG
jgi:anti-anti-sigma factor